MIKTAIVYRIPEETRRALRHMAADEREIVDPLKTGWSSIGFTAFHNGEFVYKPGGVEGFLFNVQFRDRVLPGKVIKTKLAEMIATVTENQGNAPTKAEIMLMKDALVAELLPTAFIKQTDIPVVVINSKTVGGYSYLLIGTSSAKKADDILDLFRSTTPESLPMNPLAAGLDVMKFLKDLLIDGLVSDGVTSDMAEWKFESGSSVALKHEDKSTVRFKDLELGQVSKEIDQHIMHGYRPVELHMFYGEAESDTYKMGFALTDKAIIKRLRFSDVLLKDVDETSKNGDDNDAAYFDGTAALVIGEMRQMLDALRAASEDEL